MTPLPEEPPAGFEPVEELPSHTRAALLELIGRSDTVVVSASIRPAPLGVDAIVHLTRKFDSSKKRTAVFLHRPECQLPSYIIQHQVKLLSTTAGHFRPPPEYVTVSRIQAPKKPSPITVSSSAPKSTLAMLTGSMLTVLKRHNDVAFSGNHNGVVAIRGDKWLMTSECHELLEAAEEVFDPILNDPESCARIAAAVPGSYAMEMQSWVQATGSRAARKILATMATREHVDELTQQELPRSVPDLFIKLALPGNRVLFWIAMFFTVATFGALAGAWYDKLSGNGSVGWLFVCLTIPFILIGLFTLFITCSCVSVSITKRKILKKGVFVSAKVTAVRPREKSDHSDSSSHSMNEHYDPKYIVTFQPQDTDLQEVTLTVTSKPARIAQEMNRNDQATQLLFNPSRSCTNTWAGCEPAIWLEGWVLENIPD